MEMTGNSYSFLTIDEMLGEFYQWKELEHKSKTENKQYCAARGEYQQATEEFWK